MVYEEYGRTGKRVSVVGFGGMRFDTSRRKKENAEIVRHACAKGINYFDTAPGYCNDESEDIFGIAFREMPGEFFVSTKGMPTTFHTADKARRAVEKSLKRLGVPKIHFYHIWCLRRPEHFALAMKKGGQYDGLVKCREEGLIDHIACSSHQAGHEIRAVAESGAVEGILMGVNVLNFPYRWDGVLAAHRKGLGVVAMNPLAGGAIPRHEEQFRFLCSDDESPTEAALRFNIACRQITVTLVGITTLEQVDTAVRVAEQSRPMTDAELERVRRHLSENMNAICTGCNYCEGCPENIAIASYMQFYNEKQMFGADDLTMRRQLGNQYEWGLLGGRRGAAAQCVECAQCEEKCTQHIPIVRRLKEIASWETGHGKT